MSPSSSPDLSADLSGLGGSFALSFLSLAVVCVIAWLVLRLLARKGFAGRAAGALKVMDRCALEPRRSVYLIEAAGRCFLVGVGEGAMSLLAEIDRASVPVEKPAEKRPSATPFASVLGRVLDRVRPER